MKKTFCFIWVLGLAASATAQTAIDWLTLDAGGGAQISTSYTLNFTVGQADVASSVLTSARYGIVPGFWALDNLGPATGRPQLRIVLNGPSVTFTWPSPSSGFILEQTDSLDILPASWSNAPGPVMDDGTLKSVTIPHDVIKRFYRLRKP